MNKLISALHKVVSGLSPVLYHATNIANAADILKDDRFQLGTSIGTETDDEHRKDDTKFYFLSTTRHKLGGFHKDQPGVLFVLDGVKLGHNYTGDPVDYWGESFRKVDPTKFEAEDRVWSKDPYIEPASKFIKEIHAIEYHLDSEHGSFREKGLRWVRELMKEAKKKKIPIYIYTDRAAFRALDTRKTLSLEDIQKPQPLDHDAPKYSSRHKRSALNSWAELYYNDKKEKLSEDGKYNLRYIPSHPRDGLRQLETAIHNNKTKPEMVKPIIDIMRKEKWKNLRQFWDHILEKWTKIKKAT